MKFLRVQWDRAVAVGALVLGAFVLLLGYLGVSDTAFVAEQLPYFVSGGMLGLFLLGVAGIAWISADLKDEWRELRALRDQLDDLGPVFDGLSSNGAGYDDSGPSSGRRQLRAGGRGRASATAEIE